MFRSLLKTRSSQSMFKRQRRPARRGSALFPVALERLEDRRLLSGGYSLQTLVKLGDSLANPADGVFTGDFEPGGLNNRGQLVFTSEQGTSGGDQGEGVFLTGPGGSSPIATLFLPGQPAPGGGTFGGFGTFSRDAINGEGDVAVAAGLSGGPIYYGGIYRYPHHGKPSAVVVPGVTHVPGGAAGDTFQGVSFNPSLNNGGDLVFVGVIPTTSGLAGDTLGEGLFEADKHGHIVKLEAPGDSAFGSTFVSFDQTSVNGHGDVAFAAYLKADFNLHPDSIGLGAFTSVIGVRRADGTLVSIARQGQAIPATGSQPGGFFDTVYTPLVNGEGQVAFAANIGATPTTASTDVSGDKVGVFASSHGKLISVAQPGDALPGGGTFDSASVQGEEIYQNESGEIVFGARLTSGDQGVYVWSHGVVRLVAKTGAALGGGVTLVSLDQYSFGDPTGWTLNNDRGQVAFAAVASDGSTRVLLASPQGDDGEHGDSGDHEDAIPPSGDGHDSSSTKHDDDVLGRSNGRVF